MKRSEINAIIQDSIAFFQERRFHLPPFAYWTPEEWMAQGAAVRQIIDRKLGWDVTDFGRGDYRSIGLANFTLRNGLMEHLKRGRGEVYCEKALIVDVEQVTPMHHHWAKTEDIINRGGGKLVIRLYKVAPDNGLADGEVTVRVDGISRTVAPGDTVVLSPGQSITLLPQVYHAFWAAEERVLAGEVSTVNDDDTDNSFYEPAGRFPEIEPDEAPRYLMVNDYGAYCRLGE